MDQLNKDKDEIANCINDLYTTYNNYLDLFKMFKEMNFCNEKILEEMENQEGYTRIIGMKHKQKTKENMAEWENKFAIIQIALDSLNSSSSSIISVQAGIHSPAPSVHSTDEHENFIPPRQEYSSHKTNGAKLPPITIIPFEGDRTTYAHFRNQFCSLIVERDDLKESDKFTYLLSFLKDPARKLVRGLAVKPNVLYKALDLLDIHYNESQTLLSDLAKQVIYMKTPKHMPHDLHEFYCDFQALLSKLESAEIDLTACEWILKFSFFEKLPFVLQQAIQQISGERDPSLEDLKVVFPKSFGRLREIQKTLPSQQSKQAKPLPPK